MPTKDSILEDVSQYNADQLVRFIKTGIVTFDELCEDTDGEFVPSLRREVKHLLENGDADEWAKVQSEGTVEAVQRYLSMYPEGDFRSQARALKMTLEKETIAIASQSTADAVWNSVDKTNIDALSNFVSKYPDNKHVSEANQLINNLIIDDIIVINEDTLVEKIREYQTSKLLTPAQKDNNIIDEIKNYIFGRKITKKDFLKKFSEDHNLLSAGVVKRLIDSGVITLNDLLAIQIEKPFIQKMLKGDTADDYTDIRDLDQIHKQSTEIYFWGIPSSGKSCALGAILSVANSGRVARVMNPDIASQGFGYMHYLINHFPQNEVGTLIGGTPLKAFYEMGFDLIDNENRIHPITCIDMAGELMKCMFKSNAGMHLDDDELKMLDTMTKVLIANRSTNRKMHIFVIEYGAEDRIYEGYPQRTYLEGAVSYVKNTGIFQKDTDAIFIMITKADKVKNPSKETFTRYINEKYLGFYNVLDQICKENEITGKKVEKIAFSLGEVCFQNYCKFNPKPAENVVNLILERTASEAVGIRGWLERKLRG